MLCFFFFRVVFRIFPAQKGDGKLTFTFVCVTPERERADRANTELHDIQHMLSIICSHLLTHSGQW